MTKTSVVARIFDYRGMRGARTFSGGATVEYVRNLFPGRSLKQK